MFKLFDNLCSAKGSRSLISIKKESLATDVIHVEFREQISTYSTTVLPKYYETVTDYAILTNEIKLSNGSSEAVTEYAILANSINLSNGREMIFKLRIFSMTCDIILNGLSKTNPLNTVKIIELETFKRYLKNRIVNYLAKQHNPESKALAVDNVIDSLQNTNIGTSGFAAIENTMKQLYDGGLIPEPLYAKFLEADNKLLKENESY